MFTAALAPLVIREERLSRPRLLGLLLGVVGVLLVFSDLFFSSGGHGRLSDGVLILGAAFSLACSTIFARKTTAQLPALAMACLQLSWGACVTIVVAFATEFRHPPPSYRDKFGFILHSSSNIIVVLAVLHIGIVSTAGAYLLFFFLVRRMGAIQLTQVNNLIPVVGLVLGAAAHKEWRGRSTFSIMLDVVGTCVIVAGVVLVVRRVGEGASVAVAEDIELLGVRGGGGDGGGVYAQFLESAEYEKEDSSERERELEESEEIDMLI